MTIPSAETQVRFLQDIQALLDDGQFTATYKFALLIALTDLSVESEIDDDGTLSISLESIARKFIEYYWQQSTPFLGRNAAEVLRQNSGRQAAIVSVLVQVRSEGIGSLAQLKSRATTYQRSVRRVARIVQLMPLFRLQFVGGVLRPFLYPHDLQGEAIRLNPGVAYCLRQFHTLVTGLAKDRWASMVRQLRENLYLVGQAQDLEVFLFGAGREPIRMHLDMLLDIQDGRCLYCQREIIPVSAHVDHFVPWVLHRCDSISNLVASHSECNLAKKDWLAGEIHLARWSDRNRTRTASAMRATSLEAESEWESVKYITRWAYGRAYDLGLPTWLHGREVVPLSSGYRLHLQ